MSVTVSIHRDRLKHSSVRSNQFFSLHVPRDKFLSLSFAASLSEEANESLVELSSAYRSRSLNYLSHGGTRIIAVTRHRVSKCFGALDDPDNPTSEFSATSVIITEIS